MNYYDSVFMLNKAVKNLEISKYIFLKAYAGDAIAIYRSKSWWMLEHSEIYPLKNPVETWKLFSRKNFVYGLNCLRLFNVPFGDDFLKPFLEKSNLHNFRRSYDICQSCVANKNVASLLGLKEEPSAPRVNWEKINKQQENQGLVVLRGATKFANVKK